MQSSESSTGGVIPGYFIVTMYEEMGFTKFDAQATAPARDRDVETLGRALDLWDSLS